LNNLFAVYSCVSIALKVSTFLSLKKQLLHQKDLDYKKLKKIQIYMILIVFIDLVTFSLWVLFWYLDDQDLFLIGSSLAESNVISIVVMFQMLKRESLEQIQLYKIGIDVTSGRSVNMVTSLVSGNWNTLTLHK
jgi:hypothetical protein